MLNFYAHVLTQPRGGGDDTQASDHCQEDYGKPGLYLPWFCSPKVQHVIIAHQEQHEGQSGESALEAGKQRKTALLLFANGQLD